MLIRDRLLEEVHHMLGAAKLQVAAKMDQGRWSAKSNLGALVLCKNYMLADMEKDITGTLIPKFLGLLISLQHPFVPLSLILCNFGYCVSPFIILYCFGLFLSSHQVAPSPPRVVVLLLELAAGRGRAADDCLYRNAPDAGEMLFLVLEKRPAGLALSRLRTCLPTVLGITLRRS
ncbi:hypothetical protein PR048_017838 [Dryococelus australis]|uniref:Uncharacterized protein n=1 Tax=Dryococelus australis TaxID=614101 RepID=A0ABQ9HAM2_9NEOP|nr:hypothetical protein PR048_017838 [Dryococelus australis]